MFFLFTGCGKSDEAALLAAQFDSVLPDACTAEGPKVIASTPVSGAAGVPIATWITATFNEEMDPTTIAYTNQADPQVVTFTLYDNDRPGVLLPGTVEMSAANTIATFKPTDVLAKGTTFTATITKYAKRLSDNTPLGCNYRWEFQTVD